MSISKRDLSRTRLTFFGGSAIAVVVSLWLFWLEPNWQTRVPERVEASERGNEQSSEERSSRFESTAAQSARPEIDVERSVVQAESIPITAPRSFAKEDARLARAMWRFQLKAKNSDAVLKNDYFNPERRTLSKENAKELDSMLSSIVELETEMHSRYERAKDPWIRKCLNEGRLEKLPSQPKGTIVFAPKSTDPEVETMFVSNTRKGDGFVRIGWGEDVSVDEHRLMLLAFKEDSANQVVQFVKDKGVPIK